MRYVTILSDLDYIELKSVPDDLYEKILNFIKIDPNDLFPKFQKLYDEVTKNPKNPIALKLWNELNNCHNVKVDLIQEY